MEAYRFTVPNSPVSWPKHPERRLLSKYNSLTEQLKKAAPCADTTLISPSVNESSHLQTSTTGLVPNGLPDSRGFITKKSAYKTSITKALDEDTLDVWNQSRQDVMEHIGKRENEVRNPLTTESPDQWLTTYQRNHINLLPAVAQDTRTHSFKDPYARVHHPIETDDQREKRASEHAEEYRYCTIASKDLDTLRQKLKHEQQYGVVASLKGNSVKDLDRPVKPKEKVADVAPLTTTSATTYGFFDRSFYTDINQLPKLEVNQAEEAHVQQHMMPDRYIDPYCTTYSDSYEGPLGDAECQFRKSHHFDKIQNTLQMPQQYKELKLTENNLQENTSVADIVPDHFKTMYMTMNQYIKP
jgi:hypothetical protein